MRFPNTIRIAIAAALFCGTPIFAQQSVQGFGISADALNRTVAIGEVGTLFVKITGGDAEVPRNIDVLGLDVNHYSEQSQIQIINGVRTIQVTHLYRFSSETPATYTIPPIEVILGSETYATEPVEITVVEIDQNAPIDATKPYFAKFDLSKTEFYVNEIVPLSLTGFVQGRGSIQDVLPPKLEHESFIIKPFRNVQTDGGDKGNTYYTAATMPSNLFALKAGEHRLGPATVGVRITDPGSSNFGFGGFFTRTISREMATNTINVTVKALPPGAPLSFSGGVGRFEMTATASTDEVNLGDPISVEFIVSGSGNFETLGAPDFKIPPTDLWKTYEPSKSIEKADEENAGSTVGRAVFSRVIIPEAKVESIPTFELSYFDPEAEDYVSLETPEIPITVLADDRSPAPTTITFPTETSDLVPLESVSQPTAQFADILHIRKTTPRWVSATSLRSSSTAFYLVQAAFSITFFTILGFGIVRWIQRRNVETAGISPVLTYRQSLRRIPGAGSPKRQFYHAVSTSLMLWQDEHPDAPAKVLEIVNRVMDRCETVLYSGSGKTDIPISQSDVDEVLPLLKQLSKK